jgi:hypothetical protein
VTPFTDDELGTIGAPLSETDKNGPPAADAGDAVSVTEEQSGDPLATGVTADRVTGWAIFDVVAGSYLPGTTRHRPPTAKMRDDVASDNAALGLDRYVWHRV